MAGRKSTKYPGVQARESTEKRHRGRPDVCYTIDYRDASGKRVRKDVGWASQGFSAKLASEIRAKLINDAKTCQVMGDIPIGRVSPTFGEAWLLYKKDWLEATGKDTRADIARINTALGRFSDTPLDKITAYELDRLMADMRAQGRSIQTIRHAVGLVRRIMRRMARWGLYKGPMPFDEITLPKLNNSRERYLTPDEARDLLDELGKRSFRVWLMALISLHCGLRFGEIARLRYEDVNVSGMSLFIAESKSGRSRYAVMTDDVKTGILLLPKGRPHDLLFPTKTGGIIAEIPDSFSRAVDKLGLNGPPGERIKDARRRVVFHTLRHTYASWLAAGGQGQFTIADRLGHHSLEMTRRYTHLMDESRKASAETISKTFHAKPPENQS